MDFIGTSHIRKSIAMPRPSTSPFLKIQFSKLNRGHNYKYERHSLVKNTIKDNKMMPTPG
jgi:hypothetical protein